MTTTTDPTATLLRVEALNMRKDELMAELNRIVSRVERNPTLAPELLPRVEAIDDEMRLLANSARDMRREQIEATLRKLTAPPPRPWYRRLLSWR